MRDIVKAFRRPPAVRLPDLYGSLSTLLGISGIQSEERGFAGSDDIVQWLSVLMSERNFTYDQLAEASSVPNRTIKKWFDANEKTRASPSLKKIQACLEALGPSLIV